MQSAAGVAWNQSRCTFAEMTPPRIHVAFKTHLDLGFTNDAHAVINGYLDDYLPKAIALARQLREEAPADRFVWTVGSWLITEALERLRGPALASLEKALAEGDLRWHALPFTTHTEYLDVGLVRHGLAMSKGLDRRFAMKTTAAKMTDVPGHTISMVPLLAEAGVTMLHLGVNPASTVPKVPAWSRWQHAGAEILLAYESDYGGVSLLTGTQTGLAFGFTGDNHGPPTVADIQKFYTTIRARFPKHTITASGLEGFALDAAAALATPGCTLPIVTDEIGDTWIHGVGTDPEKTRRFRALARWRASLPPDQLTRRELRRFSTALLMCGEHTWGRDVKCWNYTTNAGDVEGAWDAVGFAADRASGLHERLERSWQEQRGYLDHAIDCLAGSPLQAQARAAMALPPLIEGPWHDFALGAPVTLDHPEWQLGFDGTGALNRARHRNGTQLADATHPLIAARYEVFGASQFTSFIAAYNQQYEATWRWGNADFGKPGLEAVRTMGEIFTPTLVRASRHADGCALRVEVAFPDAAGLGCPRRWVLTVRAETNALAFDLRWYEKPATRVPEALWLRFNPPLSGPDGLRLVKLGREIDPRSVVAGGNRSLHACESAHWRGAGPQWDLELPDTGLIAPGGGALVAFKQEQPDPRDGIDLNLLNTMWGTNFPMWYEDDGVVRATLRLVDAAQPSK